MAKRPSYECDFNFNKKMVEWKRYPQELEEISDAKFAQREGMIDTPKGTVSLIDIFGMNSKGQRYLTHN